MKIGRLIRALRLEAVLPEKGPDWIRKLWIDNSNLRDPNSFVCASACSLSQLVVLIACRGIGLCSAFTNHIYR
jgi:hypothetical protein